MRSTLHAEALKHLSSRRVGGPPDGLILSAVPRDLVLTLRDGDPTAPGPNGVYNVPIMAYPTDGHWVRNPFLAFRPMDPKSSHIPIPLVGPFWGSHLVRCVHRGWSTRAEREYTHLPTPPGK